MKLVQSLACQLSTAKKRQEELEEENRELRLEVARLTEHNGGTGATEQPRPSSLGRSSTSEQAAQSSTRPTKASRLRNWLSSALKRPCFSSSSRGFDTVPSHPTPVLINGKTYTYEDGKLKLMGSGYLKAGETSHTPSWQDDTWYPDWAPKDEIPGDFQPEIESQVELKDLADRKAIEARTGLADRAWTEDPTNVFINHDVLYDIVNAAERLAKRCLWAWVRTHRPDFNMGYLSDLDFGRQALHSWINRLPFDFFDCRHTRSYEVTTKLNELVTLRNFLHHFNGRCCSVYRMDSTLQTVQELAVLLYDEDSAVHARALRDRLRQEAERTVKEFETYMLLSALPESQQTWKPHHVALVEVAAREINYKATLGAEMEYESALEPSSLPPVALATARDWMAKPAGWNYHVAQPEAPSWA